MIYQLEAKLLGEKALAKLALEHVIPNLPMFKEFDGQRAFIANGDRSAKFDKLCKSFVNSFKLDAAAGVWITGDYSIYAHLKVRIEDPKNNHDWYDTCDIYFGEIPSKYSSNNTGDFKWSFDLPEKPETYSDMYKSILKVTANQITSAHTKIDKLNKQISGVRNSLPHQFRDLLK